MTDEPRITAAEAMRRNLAAVAPIPQHISTARTLEVMQTAEVRQQRGSNEVYHPSVGRQTAAQAMRAAEAEQDRRDGMMNAPTAAQAMQAANDAQRRRIWLLAGAMDEDGKPEQKPAIRWMSEKEQKQYELEVSEAKSPAALRRLEESWGDLEMERQHDASWNWQKREYYKFDPEYETNESLMRTDNTEAPRQSQEPRQSQGQRL